jgi:hypothetical protein
MKLKNKIKNGFLIGGIVGLISGFGVGSYSSNKEKEIFKRNEKEIVLAINVNTKLVEAGKKIKEVDRYLEVLKKEKGIDMMTDEAFKKDYNCLLENFQQCKISYDEALKSLGTYDTLSQLKIYRGLTSASYDVMGLSALFLVYGARKKSKQQEMKELIEEVYRRVI